MRRFIGKLLGFEQKIRELEEKVRRMGFDESFGVLTRPALMDRAESIPRECTIGVVFLDFNYVHQMNQQLGYDEVNRRIRMTFEGAGLRKSDLVGRWFSGDELVILTMPQTMDVVVSKLRCSAEKQGMAFCAAQGVWRPKGTLFLNVVHQLSTQVQQMKSRRDARAS